MRRKKAKVLISIISVFMICLIASTAMTTVAAGDWGNLKVGDEMEMKFWPDPVEYPNGVGYIKMEILDISGSEITYKYDITMSVDSYTYSESDTETWDDFALFVYSQSYLQDMKDWAEDDPDETWTTTNHDWKGTSYKTHYGKYVDNGDIYETWVDQDTGISLDGQLTTEGTTYTVYELQNTTADLTEAGGICLGTILIAFVSVATLVTYSIVRYQKKRRT